VGIESEGIKILPKEQGVFCIILEIIISKNTFKSISLEVL
jgi:hypothetical protein